MASTLKINGTIVGDGSTPIAASYVEIQTLVLDLDGEDRLEFSQNLDPPSPTWKNGDSVELTVDGSSHPNFKGEIVSVGEALSGDSGYTIPYRAMGLNWLMNTIKAADPHTGTGGVTYNRETVDPLYLPTEAGLTVGQMFKLLLDGHAADLAAVGIAGYVATDLDLLTITPPSPTVFEGKLRNAIENVLHRWQGVFAQRVAWNSATSDWRVRFIDTTNLPATSLDFNDSGSLLDPEALEWSRDTSDCYTRVAIRGRAKIEPAYLSTLDGTLVPTWSSLDQAAWTWSDFAEPKGSVDKGTIVSLTSTSAVLKSDDGAETWTLNQWSNNHANLSLINPVATSVNFTEVRKVSSNGTMAAGGNGNVSWAGDQPLAVSTYTKYKLVGRQGGRSDVYRKFDIAPTFVKQHLSWKFNIDVPWGNAYVGTTTLFPVGAVDWSNSVPQSYGYVAATSLASSPMQIVLDRNLGQVMFVEPAVKANNGQTDLDTGGSAVKPYIDIRVVVPYSKGVLECVCPPDAPGYGTSGGYGDGGTPVYGGTAYTKKNIQRTWYEDVDAFLDYNQLASFEPLACMILDTLKDVKIDGSVRWNGLYLPALDLNMALNLLNADADLADMKCPVRRTELHWPPSGGTNWVTILTFNNRRQLATGEDLYIHPAFTADPRQNGGAFSGLGFEAGVAAGAGAFSALYGGYGSSVQSGDPSQSFAPSLGQFPDTSGSGSGMMMAPMPDRDAFNAAFRREGRDANDAWRAAGANTNAADRDAAMGDERNERQQANDEWRAAGRGAPKPQAPERTGPPRPPDNRSAFQKARDIENKAKNREFEKKFGDDSAEGNGLGGSPPMKPDAEEA